MRAFVDGIEVDGTPKEISEFLKIHKLREVESTKPGEKKVIASENIEEFKPVEIIKSLNIKDMKDSIYKAYESMNKEEPTNNLPISTNSVEDIKLAPWNEIEKDWRGYTNKLALILKVYKTLKYSDAKKLVSKLIHDKYSKEIKEYRISQHKKINNKYWNNNKSNNKKHFRSCKRCEKNYYTSASSLHYTDSFLAFL